MTHARNYPLTRRHALAITAGAGLAACAPQGNGAPTQAALDPAGCWTAMPPLPFDVQEIYAAAHNGRVHVAGGLLGAGGRVTGASDRHIAYDPATGESAELATLPGLRHHPHLVSHGGRLFMLGGFTTVPGRVDWTTSADAFVHDDAANAWTQLASAPDPNAEVVAASLGARIHAVGGRKPRGEANLTFADQEDVTHHLVYDPAANAWNRAAPALSARNSASGAVINGLWHVVGGRGMASGPTDAHEVYDPREDRWRNATPMPQGSGAGGNVAVALGGALYAFGGEVFGSGGAPGRVHPEVWRYDPARDAWDAAAPMPTPRHGLGAAVVGDAAYLVGGATNPGGNGTTNAVERFTLAC